MLIECRVKGAQLRAVNVTFMGSCGVGPAMRAALQTSLTGGKTAAQSHTSVRLSLISRPSVCPSLMSPLSDTAFILLPPHCPGRCVCVCVCISAPGPSHVLTWFLQPLSVCVCVCMCVCVCVSELYMCAANSLLLSGGGERDGERPAPLIRTANTELKLRAPATPLLLLLLLLLLHLLLVDSTLLFLLSLFIVHFYLACEQTSSGWKHLGLTLDGRNAETCHQ